MTVVPGSDSSAPYPYQPGGSLPSEAPTYVVRQADRELHSALLARQYCYILNARQMGKSSLRIRTMSILEQEGIACADVELSGIGSQQITAAQWYGGIIQELSSGFGLSFKRRAWLQEREDLSPVQRLSQFIETVLLVQIQQPIVIFIDEIDSVLGLSFPTDEFFALIRNCYDKRAKKANYQRLTFAILGVATPSDLIRDKQYSTPFNIGKSIALEGFKFQDCGPLIQGFTNLVSYPAVVMQEILRWTGGQPFLTQKLCWLVIEHLTKEHSSGIQFSKADLDAEADRDIDQLDEEITVIQERFNPDAPWATPSFMRALVNAKILKPTDLMNTAGPSKRDLPLEQGLLSPDDPGSAKRTRALVKMLVKTKVLKDWEAQDEPEHLRTIRDRLIRTGSAPGKVLQLYRQVLQQGGIASKSGGEYLQLRLSGAVDVIKGDLKVKNPIYAKIFNLSWVDQELTRILSRSMAEPVTAAIVYTEIESLTARMAEDERHVLRLMQRDFALMNRYCQQYEGTLLRTLGDGLLMSFESVDKAVQCAIKVQKMLGNAAVNRSTRDHLWHRIGIHVGDLYFDGQDVMGTGVNIAAILQEKAVGGGICLSQEAYDAVSRHLVIEATDIGEHAIKGLSTPMQLYQLPPHRPGQKKQRRWWQTWPSAVVAGAIASGVIIGVRATGFLQPWEFRAYDQFMRARPEESPDDRLFLVSITDQDVQAQPFEERVGLSLSDQALSDLIAKLDQGLPRAIGVDIYRERATQSNYPELAQALANNDRIFGVCFLGEPGISAPPEISPARQGFNNVQIDADGVLRRQMLAVDTPIPCQTRFSLAWSLASRYLAEEGIKAITSQEHLNLGETKFPPLQRNAGGYYGLSDPGQQILLNFRATPHIAESATLSEVLSTSFDPSVLQDRIVIIGTVASGFNDTEWITPYSGGWKYQKRLTGVEVQAHMTSQILSAVLDDRPLIWSWTEPIEWLWIMGWTLSASVVAMQLRSRRWITIYLGGMMVLVAVSCWGFMMIGGWIPFIPTVLGIFLAGVLVNAYRKINARKITQRIEARP